MDNWHQSYDKLTGFIASHPAIEIKPSIMIIPDDLRAEFYRLFDEVRSGFVKEKQTALLAEAFQLSTSFATAKEETTVCLALKSVEVKPNLSWFLQDPVEGLMRKLFDPLFGILQGTIDFGTFEGTSAHSIESAAKIFLHQGYTHWVMLSLMRLFAPDRTYIVPVADETTQSDLTSADTRPGWYTEDIPDIIAAGLLLLDVSPHLPFIVPKIILRSGKLNTFIALSTDFHDVYRKARDKSKNIEWYDIDAIRREFGTGNLWPDMAIYLGNTGEDLRVVADYSQVARPDIIVDVMESADWYASGGMKNIKRHYDILKPKLSSIVVCRYPAPQSAVEEFEPPSPATQVAQPTGTEIVERVLGLGTSLPTRSFGPNRDIRILNVGFDAKALEPIIEVLRNKSRLTT